MTQTRSHDIREWAKANGKDINDRGRVPLAIEAEYISVHGGGVDDEDGGDDLVPPFSSAEPEAEPSSRVEETPPKVPSTSERIKDSFRRARSKKTPAKKPATKRASHPRASIEGIMSTAWGVLAGGVAKTGLLPAGYIMDKQAPAAGMVLDDALKDSAIDRLVQPLARQSERARVFKALFLPPIAVSILQMRPDLYDQLEQPLRKSIGDWLDVAGPKMAEIKRREEKYEAEFGEDINDIMEGVKAMIALAYQQKAQAQGAADAADST